MTNFWDTTEGEAANKTGGDYDAGGGDITPIPKGTQCLAAIDEVSWDIMGEKSDAAGEEYIKVRWSVLAAPEYKNRKVFQKIRVLCLDTKKADKAKRMLAAIDANAGGKLSKSNELPMDESLIKALCNKPMVIMCQVWAMTTDAGEDISGNWISAVSPRAGKMPSKSKAAPAAAPEPEVDAAVPATNYDSFDEDVGF
jgi:hypothetical protein